jgi:acyl dehydratase
MRFAELTVGRVIQLGPASLTEQQIVEYARVYDPQWFHTDPIRAATSQWQGLIASGWQTCGVAMRLVCDGILAGSESFGSPGLAYLKWESPVRAGDALHLAVEVLEQRVAKSNPALAPCEPACGTRARSRGDEPLRSHFGLSASARE